MDILDRWAKRRLEDKGYLRAAYSPAPSAVLGLGDIQWPGDDDADPELYLKYARTSNVVYACSTIRANMLSGLPLRAYKFGAEPGAGRVRSVREPHERYGLPLEVRGQRVSDAADVTEVEGGKLVDLLRRVNRWWTPRRLVYMTEFSLCLAGQSFWQLDKGEQANRPPSDIYYVKHTRMAPRKHPTEIIEGWTLDPHTRGSENLAADEVVWFRFPDPTDPDYGALAPLAAARLGADVYAASMKSNWAMFANGLAPGGFVLPPEGQTWETEQLDEAAEQWHERLLGVDKRHRWLFMPEPYTIKENTLTPKDAEFLGGLDFSVEDVARAFGLPIELVGGARRTYQNLENAMRAVWMLTLEPEASFIAAEMTEQLVPMFDGEVDFVAFDLSDVTALQEDEALRWARAKDQITGGAITINEWRAEEGLGQVEWGDVAWMPAGVQPIADGTAPAPPPNEPLVLAHSKNAETATAGGTDGEGRGARLTASQGDRMPEFGSPEHERAWRQDMEKQEPHVRRMIDLVDTLFERQLQSMLDKMGAGERANKRATLADLRKMFNMGHWVREFRTAARPIMTDIARSAGGDLFAQVGEVDPFDPNAPEVVKAMVAQAHDFASTINKETWTRLNRTLAEGIGKGEGLRPLMDRVSETMTGMQSTGPLSLSGAGQSRAEMIARTETTRAWNKGAHEAAMKSDRVEGKRWMSALDTRTRPAHAAAHGQEVPKGDPFVVGGEEGMAPGDFPSAGNVVNCRCSVVYTKAVARPDVVIDETPDGTVVTPLDKWAPGGVPWIPSAVGDVAPVSAALDTSGLYGKSGEKAKDAVRLIDEVHTDGNLKRIPMVTDDGNTDRLGGFIIRDGKPLAIEISTRPIHPKMTAAHEIGHLLDFEAIGAPGRMATAGGPLAGLDDDVAGALGRLQGAIKESEAHQTLIERARAGVHRRNIGSPRDPVFTDVEVSMRHTMYLTEKHEEFARAYAQYIAQRSGDPEMLRELASELGPSGQYTYDNTTYPTQWSDRDFKDIADAFDNLFRVLGWL